MAPRRQRFTTADVDSTIRILDAATTTVIAERFLVSDFPITGLAYVDDGAQLMIAGRNNFLLQRLDAETLEPHSASTPLFNGSFPSCTAIPRATRSPWSRPRRRWTSRPTRIASS